MSGQVIALDTCQNSNSKAPDSRAVWVIEFE